MLQLKRNVFFEKWGFETLNSPSVQNNSIKAFDKLLPPWIQEANNEAILKQISGRMRLYAQGSTLNSHIPNYAPSFASIIYHSYHLFAIINKRIFHNWNITLNYWFISKANIWGNFHR